MDKAVLLEELQQTLENSFQTLPLAHQKEDLVHGEGDPQAKIMCIGEAPGREEALQRRPFVGRSGQLLRKKLVEIGLPPAKVFISNIVKVRPPENRDPTPQEIAAYRPFLNREIEIIQPEIIVTLGRFSMAKFLPEVKVSQVHGRLHKVVWEGKDLFVLPMYHPAAALRSTKMMESFTYDFKKLPKILSWLVEQNKTEKLKGNIKDILF
ncbi:MAG: uracil-DNA glycosylase [Patescibacteria group bacterium]